jgi:hypothetical protein
VGDCDELEMQQGTGVYTFLLIKMPIACLTSQLDLLGLKMVKIYRVIVAKSAIRGCFPFLEKSSSPFSLPSHPNLTALLRAVEFFIGPTITGVWVVFHR